MDFGYVGNQVGSLLNLKPIATSPESKQKITFIVFIFIFILVVVLIVVGIFEWQLNELDQKIERHHVDMLEKTTDLLTHEKSTRRNRRKID